MHKLTLICALLVVPALAAGQDTSQAAGQATVISGFASNRVSAPNLDAPTNPPVINTPSVTLGATAVSSNGPFATLTWYGAGTNSPAAANPSEAVAQPEHGTYLNSGVTTSQYDKGVARLMAEQHLNRQSAVRVYTNHDMVQLVEQLNQSTGVVKYGNVTVHLE